MPDNKLHLVSVGFAGVPAIISAAGERASFRFVEFFTANIRNKNTRLSYGASRVLRLVRGTRLPA
jgi:hypothetical protein